MVAQTRSVGSRPRRSWPTAARYAYDGTDVVHTVEMSLYPNWVGTRQLRHVRLSDDGNTLELSTDPLTLDGRRATQRLTWLRDRA